MVHMGLENVTLDFQSANGIGVKLLPTRVAHCISVCARLNPGKFDLEYYKLHYLKLNQISPPICCLPASKWTT
jgi:hypothetical protein